MQLADYQKQAMLEIMHSDNFESEQQLFDALLNAYKLQRLRSLIHEGMNAPFEQWNDIDAEMEKLFNEATKTA